MEKKNYMIRETKPSSEVEIHLPDGRVYRGLRDTPVGKFLNELPEAREIPFMGAVVNGELRELTFPIHMESTVKPVSIADADGAVHES